MSSASRSGNVSFWMLYRRASCDEGVSTFAIVSSCPFVLKIGGGWFRSFSRLYHIRRAKRRRDIMKEVGGWCVYSVSVARLRGVQEGERSFDCRMIELQGVIAAEWFSIDCKLLVASRLHRRHLLDTLHAKVLSENMYCDHKLMLVQIPHVEMAMPLVALSLAVLCPGIITKERVA
jgi:hypothetical protein